MKLFPITSALALAAMATTSQAQTVLHYWDFETMNDVAGGLTTSAVGTPDLSINATYGEALPGLGKTLNTVLSGTAAGGGFLEADVHDGTNPTAMLFDVDDFSVSYWSFFADDGDARGPRIFDSLLSTDTGLQLGSNATPLFNYRIDDHEGGSTLSNNTLAIMPALGVWTHVAVTVDRANFLCEVYFDGVSQGTYPLLSTATGRIEPSQDLQIGVINGGGNEAGAQEAGLDELAFYEGLLSASQVMGLANGTLGPMDFQGGPGTGYCFGDGVNMSCPCGNNNDGSVPGAGCANGAFASGAKLTGMGVASLAADTLVLATTGLEPNQSGLYFQADNNLDPGLIWGDGLQCAGGSLKRLGVRFSDGTGYSDTSGYPQAISVKAGNVTAGDTKYYQCWYRNPVGSPCGSDFNASNGYAVTWMP